LARGNKDPIVYLATRISAKEAIYKALWPRWSKSWKSVSILNVNSKPMVFQEQNEYECHISISHDANFVIAFAVAYELK
jgi:phosphopantetheinyl transferase (holo-ACP synthase)